MCMCEVLRLCIAIRKWKKTLLKASQPFEKLEKQLADTHVCIKTYTELCTGETRALRCLFEYGIIELGKVVITISEEKRTIIP